MKTKAIILNLVAFLGVLGSFYLSGLNAFTDWSYIPPSYSFPVPENNPISEAFVFIYPGLSFIFYGLLFSGVVLFCCSAIAVTLKLRVVSIGGGIGFDVPRDLEEKTGK